MNRDWQVLVEEQTGATLRVKTGTPLNLHGFENATKDPRWRSCIRNIKLILELGPYDETARAHFETEAEHRLNNQTFSEAIRSLLRILAKWPVSQSGLSLSIQAQSPSDFVASLNRLKRKKAARADRTIDLEQLKVGPPIAVNRISCAAMPRDPYDKQNKGFCIRGELF